MRVKEIIAEDVNYAGIAKSVAPTVASNLVKDYPWAEKLVSASPYAASAIKDLLSGNATSATINIIQGILPYARLAPKELKSVTGLLSNASTAGAIAGHIGAGSVAAGAVPIATLAAPFMLAGHEKEKIDADPWNKAYDNNPYAQSVRSSGKITQGQAGAANRRNAIKNYSTAGNPSQ